MVPLMSVYSWYIKKATNMISITSNTLGFKKEKSNDCMYEGNRLVLNYLAIGVAFVALTNKRQSGVNYAFLSAAAFL